MESTAYIQVLSLGIVWTTIHCTGMCGPLIIGVTARADAVGSRRRRARLRARRVFAYQGGKALTYGAFGAMAGAVGRELAGAFERVAAVTSLFVAAAFIAIAISKLVGRRRRPSPFVIHVVPRAMQAIRRLRMFRGDMARTAAIGAVMGFLPCTLVFWVLGVASSTQSALHGAGVMLLLVVLATPSLLAAACSAGALASRSSERRVALLLLLSALWLTLVAAAANGWIAHRHVTFTMGDEPYMLMLF